MLLLLGGRDEDVQDLITLPEKDEVGAASRQLKDEGAPPDLGAEFEEDQSISSNLLELAKLRASELLAQALIEGPLRSVVANDALVLQVEPAGLRLAGEVDPEDRRVRPSFAGEEGQDGVPRGAGLYITQGGADEEPAKLLDQFADLSPIEAQLSSSPE